MLNHKRKKNEKRNRFNASFVSKTQTIPAKRNIVNFLPGFFLSGYCIGSFHIQIDFNSFCVHPYSIVMILAFKVGATIPPR